MLDSVPPGTAWILPFSSTGTGAVTIAGHGYYSHEGMAWMAAAFVLGLAASTAVPILTLLLLLLLS